MIDLDVAFAGDDAILPASQYRALKAVAEAASGMYASLKNAHERGQTFPFEISVAGARLSEALAALKDA